MTRPQTAAIVMLSGACALGAAEYGDSPPGAAVNLPLAAVAALVAVALATPFALALGRLRFEGRALGFTILILASATTPALLERDPASLLNQFADSLALAVPVAVWIIYLLARALPPEIEDAAKLDGASPVRAWLPLLRPALLSATPLVFLYCAFDLASR